MALELVTGYWGQEHVTAEQDADLNAGVVGGGMHVLPIGEKMRAEAVTSNKVRIFDGLFLGYGRQCVIEEGAYEDVEIENGTAGLLRNDMIIIKYAKDEVTGVEGVSFGVLKGQTGATAVDPVPNNQDIRSGTFESEMPLYRVKLNGLAIEAIQPLFAVPKSIAALTTALDDLNRNMMRVNVATDPTLFNKNFLSLNLGTPDANERISCIFGKDASDSTYSNVPSAVSSVAWIGTRYVIMRSTTQAMVKIDEMYPTAGRQWSNFYNNGTWSGWKVLTPA